MDPRLHPLLLVSSLIATVPRSLPAQMDTVGVGAAVSRARDALRGLKALWRADGATIDWIFVSQAIAFRTRGSGPLETVSLPAGAPRANTSYTLGGDRLAMVVLPLGQDIDANARLLVHEAMHTLQPQQLPHPGNTEPTSGSDLLDRADGRTWLFLELRATARRALRRRRMRSRFARTGTSSRLPRNARVSMRSISPRGSLSTPPGDS